MGVTLDSDQVLTIKFGLTVFVLLSAISHKVISDIPESSSGLPAITQRYQQYPNVIINNNPITH